MKQKILRTLSVVGVLASLLFGYTHCVIEAPKKATKRSTATSSSSNPSTNTNSGSSSGSTTTTPTPTPVPPVGTTARDHFDQTVKTAFENQCMVCHTEPFNNPPIAGPLSIYNYDAMKVKLMNGNNGTDNELMQKVQMVPSHAGGNRCPGGLGDNICMILQDWYNREIPNPVPPVVVNPTGTGSITDVSSRGKIIGWAANPADTNMAVNIKLYLDGPVGTGVLIEQVVADKAGFNGGYPGAHAFITYLPVTYRDGQLHQIYAYATVNGQDILLTGSPWASYSYTSTLNGFNHYNNVLRPILQQRCSACHAITYETHFESLLSPSPAMGGSATNNEMINMPSGSHLGTNHPGGNICGDKNSSPCAEIQTWWNLEFN